MQKQPDFHHDPSLREAMRLAQSEAGQRLLSTLQQTHQEQLDHITASSQSGDMEQVKQAMQELLSNPEIQTLLKKLGG